MELHQIRKFLGLSGMLNFTKAARKSTIYNPGLAKFIKSRGDERSCLLLYRNGKDTGLKTLGKQILLECSQSIQIGDGIYKLTPILISQNIKFILQKIPLLMINLYPRFSSERADWIQQIGASGSAMCIVPSYSSISNGLVTRPVEKLYQVNHYLYRLIKLKLVEAGLVKQNRSWQIESMN